MSFKSIQLAKIGLVAHITLNRPQALNAVNMAMRDDLFQALTAIRDDPTIRLFIISGSGRGFCAGADLKEFGTAPSVTIARDTRRARDIWELLRAMEKPGIAALHGPVLGAGLEIALFCDLRLAAEGVVLGLPETTLGMVPSAGGSQTLIRSILPGLAAEMLLTGQRIDGPRALQIGLISRLLPEAELMRSALAMAAALAEAPSFVVQGIKAAVRDGMDLPLPQALILERRMAARSMM